MRHSQDSKTGTASAANAATMATDWQRRSHHVSFDPAFTSATSGCDCSVSKRAARREHPLDAANLISKLFFGWMFPFIWRGWRIGLKLRDMPEKPSAEESCHKIGQKLVALWEEELATAAINCNKSNAAAARDTKAQPAKRPNLTRAVIKAHARWILLNSLLTFFAEVVCKSLSAYSVGQMLLHMNNVQREPVEEVSGAVGAPSPLLFWTVSLILAVCLWVLTAHFYGFQMMRVGLHVRVGCSYLIYRKSLKLAQYESSHQTTMGKMVNLLSNDLDKFNYVCIMLPFLWIGPIQTIVSIYLLWPLLGPSCLGSLLVLFILTPIQFYLSRKFASFRRRIAAYTDERVRLLNETITALQLIKLYAWEYPFRAAMAESRQRETDMINRVSIIKGISTAFMYVSSKLVLFVTIIFHTLVFGAPLDAKTLFMSMAMLNNVQFTMTQLLPRVVSLGVESLVSLRRITDFLLTKDFEASDKLSVELVHNEVVRSNSCSSSSTLNTAHDINKLMPRQEDLYKRTAFVECKNVGARWPSAETRTIEGFSFRCESPGLIIICGQVASGKSSLFMSLLNELPIREGQAKIRGSCSYSSQVPWIFDGTVRDNIIFGYGYNKSRYEQVLEVCALKRDLELLDFGDFTYIQENSLSGGQKARVNLARTLYRNSDIYLLDDPFSAIDGRVANHIFEEAIVKFLSGKLVLLATHQVRFLKRSHKVLLLDQGKQLAYCNYQELLKKLNKSSSSNEVDKDVNCFSADQLERLSFLLGDSSEEECTDNIVEVQEKVAERNVADGANDKKYKVDKITVNLEESPSSGPIITKQKQQLLKGKENTIESATNKTPGEHFNGQTNSTLVHCTRSSCKSAIGTDGRHVERTILNDDGEHVNDGYNDDEVNKRQQQTEDFLDEACKLCCVSEENLIRCRRLSHTDCDKASKKLDPTTTTTSESIHAPYGFANLLVYNGDKTLITASEASGQRVESTSATVAEVAVAVVAEAAVAVAKAGVESEAKPTVAVNSQVVGEEEALEGRSKANGGGGGTLLVGQEAKTANKVHTTHSAAAAAAHTTTAVAVTSATDGRPVNIAKSSYRTTISQPEQQTAKKAQTHSLPTTGKWKKNIPDENPAKTVGNFTTSPDGPASEETSCSRLPGIRVWYNYYTQTSVIRLVLIILTFLITQTLLSTVDIYLTVWSLTEQNKALLAEVTASNQQYLNSFKHDVGAHINQHQHHHEGGVANKTGIQYDLMVGNNLPTLMSFTTLDHNRYNCTTDPMSSLEMAQEIHKVGISPLSFRTSQQLPLVMPMNNLFVPLLNLFYTTGNFDSTATTTVSTTPTAAAAASLSTSTYPSNFGQFQQVSGETVTALPSDGTSSSGSMLVDQSIFEESEAALNVKSIYRPLYMFVNNFTSGHHALTYTLLLMVLFSCSAITNVLSLTSSNKSAISLYRKLIDNALFAKLAFFDQNPIGRFLNRATRDIGIIDEAIPYNANQAYDALLQTAATFIVVALVDINLALPSLIILFIFLIYHSIHVKPTKDIQRFEGISRSPIISHISTTLTGLHTIRATKSEHRFEQLFIRHQDAHTSMFLLYLGCNRSMAVVLDSLSATYTGVIAFWAVVSGLTGPSAGLIITSAMLLSGLTQHGVMKLTETESLMTSVERVIEYCSLPQEESYDRSGKLLTYSNGNRSAKVWMKEASVEYRNVDLYYNRAEKPVLKNISFKLKPGEKIGVVGRTGAGKSSIISTLFRLYEFDGTILIDGVDTKKLDLFDLRSAIGIIPQTPIVFSTSIRKNLDPFDVYDDFSIWAALDKAHLRETVSALPGKLNHNIGSGGGFSSGQKQLICLARVLLRQNSLIVMDEATANVDPNTDAIIQSTIRREFKHCTVITIAHRLETILDCDRIMVLEAGRVVDFDTPERMVAKGNSHFASIVQKSVVG